MLQPDGDLVVVGTAGGSNVGGPFPTTYSGFFVLRYTANGKPDPSFQSSQLLGVTNGEFLPPAYSGATGVALQSNKIIMVGEVTGVAKVVRLNSDGSLDTSFGTGGVVTLGTVGSGDSLLDYASAVSVLPGGQIAVGGSASPTAGHDIPAVEVLNADGSIDTGYGTGGLAVAPLPANAQAFAGIAPYFHGGYLTGAGPVSMALEPDGEVAIAANAVLSGTTPAVESVVTVLTTAGVPDATFGTAGQATITPQSVLTTATSVSGTSLAAQPDGELLVGGAVFLPGSPYRMVVARLTAAGVPDAGFGTGGVSVLPSATTVGANVGAIALQPDGKIVLADGVWADFARLDGDGSLDVTFGTAGQSVIYGSTPTLQAGPVSSNVVQNGTVGLAIAPDGKILATQNDGVRQLLGRGAVGDYDGDGISDRAIYITSLGDFAYTPSSGAIGPIIHFGPPGVGQTLPAPGAYGGQGIDELGVYIPAFGEFAIASLQTGQIVLAPFGPAGVGNSLPAPGDYDKSGATELAIYAPATGIYAYRPAGGGPDVYVAIGTPGAGSIPVPGDYFGTGQDDVAVYEPATASYVLRDPSGGQTVTVPFGIAGAGNSIPVPGDYDGSGHTELAVYLPGLAELVYRPALGGPDVTVPFGLAGAGLTLPAPGDYDGSGRTEVAAYFPSTGIFAYRPAGGGSDVYQQIGTPGQTIPFTPVSATDAAASAPPPSPAPPAVAASASAEIPLTPDVLDSLATPGARKKAGQA